MPIDKRLIEEFLPIQTISAEASREKSVRKGHISTLHLWWARRPLVACRAAVYGALVPASRFIPENGPDLPAPQSDLSAVPGTADRQERRGRQAARSRVWAGPMRPSSSSDSASIRAARPSSRKRKDTSSAKRTIFRAASKSTDRERWNGLLVACHCRLFTTRN